MNITLRRKLLSIVVLVTLVCTPPIVLGLVLDARLDQARDEAQRTAEAIDALTALEFAVMLEGGAVVERFVILNFNAPALIEQYREATADAEDLMADLHATVPDDFDQELDVVVDSYERLIPALDSAISQGAGAAGELFATTELVAETFDANARLGDALEGRVVDQRAEVDRLRNQLVAATLTSLVLAMLTAAGGLYLVTSGLVRRMNQLAEAAARFVRDEPMQPQPRSRDEIGQLVDSLGYAGALLDTRRREALAATKAKDDFLARVSHELKTPLTAMIGFAQLIEEDPDLSPEDRDGADHIITAGHHLHGLIEELLDIKAIEAGKLAMAIGPVRAHAIAIEALALVQPMADTHAVALALDCPDTLEVRADPKRLREVLLNLLSNAVKYNQPGGRVDLTATSTDGTARLRVTDTGPGIAPEDHEVVFKPFERLDAGATDVEGSGVGLALTKNVVEAMGGTIGLDSQPGRGSTFWVDLPTAGAGAPGDTGRTAVAGRDGSGAAPRAPDEGLAPARGATATLPRPVPARTRLGRRWMDMPLRYKLLSIVAIVVLICTPPIAVGLVLDAELDEARAAVEQSAAAGDALNDLRDAALHRGHAAVQQHVLSAYSEPEIVEAYRSAMAEVPELIDELDRNVPDDLGEQLTRLEEAYDTAIRGYDAVMAIGPTTPGGPASPEELLVTSDGTAGAFAADGRFDDALDTKVTAQRADVDRLQGQLVWAMLVGLVLALVATACGIYLVTTGLVRRIEQLIDTSARFLDGRPMHPMTSSRDEIGQLNETMTFAGELLDARRHEALAATKAKDEFLSRVSHELKTPLTAMIGFADLLTESPGLSHQSSDDARRISGAGRHLHELIEELLDIKAIEAGKLTIAIEPVPVCDAVEESVGLVAPRAAGRSITISADCPPDVAVAADPRRMREVLLNLLSNAVKYNREGGRVEVTAVRHDTAVHIAVADTGPGISASDQARLFHPFERLDAGATDVEGSGVGLALTKNVVEAMGGTIGIDSAPGQGSTFWFDLPTPGPLPEAAPLTRVGDRPQ